MSDAVDKQDLPHRGVREISPLLLKDMEEKASRGAKKYGLPLESHNGRDAVKDAYQEVLDLAMYLRQTVEEDLYGRAKAARDIIISVIGQLSVDRNIPLDIWDKYFIQLNRAERILEGTVEL